MQGAIERHTDLIDRAQDVDVINNGDERSVR